MTVSVLASSWAAVNWSRVRAFAEFDRPRIAYDARSCRRIVTPDRFVGLRSLGCEPAA